MVINKFKQKYFTSDVDLDNKSTLLSGIIQSDGTDPKTAKVVVVATGTKGIDADYLYNNNSENVVPDTHAEVVARRCLLYYFYEQINLYLQSGNVL